MNLKYKDYFVCNCKNEVKKIYMNSFSKSERFPFWILKKCSKEQNVLFSAILDANKLIGIQYVIKCKTHAYLMYLAVDKDQRKKGYGSQILNDLIKQYTTIVLCIERTDKFPTIEKAKRKEFYLKNGFYETNKFIEDNGIQYEILCTNRNYNITKENLAERYIKMTRSLIIKRIISKLFNVHNINFIR